MIIDIPLITVIIAIIACLYASYSDLKRGIIPNKLTFPLIAIGLILNGIYAFMLGELWIIIVCLVVTGVIFALGYLFWKMGAWAGGDVKLFTALAALIPFNPILISYEVFQVPFPVEGIYPFPLTVIINSILSILPFLLIYVFYVVAKNKPHLMSELTSPVKDYRKNIVLTLVITSAVNITFLITQQVGFQIIIISLILIYILSLLISKLPNQVKAVVVSLITVAALFYNFKITIISVIVLFISIIIIEIVRKLLTSVSREALQDDIPLDELQEGMIPAYNLYQRDNDEVLVDDKSFTDKMKDSFKTRDPSILTAPPGKRLVGTLAAGLSNEDIQLLKQLHQDGKISNKFRVKKGVPFAPSILIGLIISLFIGDLAYILQKILIWIMY
ncbi:A24 family peptidase C-terminal domain-containing protein [Methanobacterium sp.]|uniref:A24 family peptidase C-terminal domain-containing protein n=1 Tax=Methanobacterium sp. TaxID=2164 RepID=UPI002AB96F62|nr:A24 family peptidase C-terminal domain-containing protein [Methanobacterium sp.]MDY9922374.1 A24 family peptidase C-terminal domain-containing protein [Methanobacterium sp.]